MKKKKNEDVMRETIIRNREALGRTNDDDKLIDSFVAVNKTVTLGVIDDIRSLRPVGYILADGLIVGYDQVEE